MPFALLVTFMATYAKTVANCRMYSWYHLLIVPALISGPGQIGTGVAQRGHNATSLAQSVGGDLLKKARSRNV